MDKTYPNNQANQANQANQGRINNGQTNPVASHQSTGDEPQIKIDGYNQVLEMLKIADPEFRESLLRRLTQRDPELGRTLRRELGV